MIQGELNELNNKLFFAVKNGITDKTEKALCMGANVNIMNSLGQTVLMYASWNGYTDIAKLLLKYGADINLPDYYKGSTALIHACRYGHTDIVRLLIEHGADVNIGDTGGNTPLHTTMPDKNTECMSLLIEAGADINAINNPGWTPILIAAKNGSISYIKLLAKAGADINPMVWTLLHRRYPDRYQKYADELKEFIAAVKKLREEDLKKPSVTGYEFDI